jgi:hypothetical protein
MNTIFLRLLLGDDASFLAHSVGVLEAWMLGGDDFRFFAPPVLPFSCSNKFIPFCHQLSAHMLQHPVALLTHHQCLPVGLPVAP